MRRFASVCLLGGLVLHASAAKRITVAQLEQNLSAAMDSEDAKEALLLTSYELTERLSTVRMEKWEAGLPGPRSRQALLALADASAFLDVPPDEIPPDAVPVAEAQRQMMALVVTYVNKTTHQLPNLFADRNTTRFANMPADHALAEAGYAPQPLHVIGKSDIQVVYRDGHEVIDTEGAKAHASRPQLPGLVSWGEFGPILSTVLLDAAQSQLGWSHWEKTAGGLMAVFRYAVPKEKSHYQLQYCCERVGPDQYASNKLTAYHGEMAIDPATGAVRRLTVQADAKPGDALVKAAIAVEYGPIEIAEKTYICPLRSVAVSLAPIAVSPGSGFTFANNTQGPPQTLLNDVAFGSYHRFGAETKIVADGDIGGGKDLEPGAEGGEKETASVANAEVAPGEGAAGPAAVTATPVGAAASPAAAAEPVTAAATPAPADTAKPEFTLRMHSRLVDVGVVAYDKKGHRVMDLKADDFEVYDNGRRQQVRFFTQAGGPTAAPAAAASAAGVTAARMTGPGRDEAAAGSITVLLIDAGNLSFGDLNYARSEILRFLKSAPKDERIALAAMKAGGTQILLPATTDRNLLSERLKHWMPSARDLSRAQDEEDHNRQRIETVQNAEDLDHVNGNNIDNPDAGTSPDVQLRSVGRNPGQAALENLAAVAKSLAELPGHKSLVWISSDNALAEFSEKAARLDKGGKSLDAFALRAQEAMNDAHVSLYPLDASQLEAGSIDAGIENRSVELAPTPMGAPAREMQGGRLAAQMQQDIHPIQPLIRQVADATGGHAFARAGDIDAELHAAVQDGRATYLLSFTPDQPADDAYHALTVKLTGDRKLSLRYRTGYEYKNDQAAQKK